MNYLDLINSFWKLRKEIGFSPAEADVYYYLLNKANESFWSKSLKVSTNLACVELEMSRPTFTKARNKLKQKNLIDFIEGNRNTKTQYTIIDSVKNFNVSINASINTSVNASAYVSVYHDIGKDIRHKTKTKDFSLKKDKQQVVYPKKNENDFSEKNFSEQNQVTNQESFTKSVNSEEEKRKKVAPKKEKRFFDDVYTLASESTENVAGSFVNQPTESRSVCFEKTENANKSVLNDDFYSNEVNVPQKKKSLLKQKETASKFIPPSVSEVAEYCQERNNDVLPEKFVDFYTGKGWMIGKNKMKDWRACVRTWEKNNKNQNNQYKKTYVKKEENIEPTIGRMKLSDVKKMMTGWD